MRCVVCKKGCQEVELYNGILEDGMVMVCETCADEEKIPIIKKPSESQLNKADERHSVRERMERMSGVRDPTEISPDQTVVQGTIAKLRAPPKKENHPDILDNYYWTLNIARRRKKMTTSQLAEKTQIEPQVIRAIERGRIPENFKETFLKLESFLGIKLLKNHVAKVTFTRTKDEEQEILNEVKRRMDLPELPEIKKPKKAEDIDFSHRENLEDVTLNDLIEIKRKREERERQLRIKSKEASFIDDDIDLDIEEL